MIKVASSRVIARVPLTLMERVHRHARERGRTVSDLIKEGLLMVMDKDGGDRRTRTDGPVKGNVLAGRSAGPLP